jgi:NitT/TauT family transport system permease protein
VTRSTVARPAPPPGSAPTPSPAATALRRPGRPGPRGDRTSGGPKWLVSSAALVVAVLGWAVAARVVDDNILPGPAEVFGRVVDYAVTGAALDNFTSSIVKILAGFALAMLAGLPIGFLMGRSRFLTSYFSMPLFVLGNVPGLTYAVFGLVIFGVGDTGPVVVSALVAVPFIAMNVAEGVRSVDGGLLRMCQAFDRGRVDVYRSVYLPAITAFVFVGIRYGFAMAWKVEALTEVFGANDGVGFMIRRAYQEFQVADMLAWTMLFVLVMVLIERGLARLESRIFAWRKDLA